MREALSSWRDEQEQLAGFLDPQVQREQFQAVYRSVAKRRDWVPHPPSSSTPSLAS